MEEPSKIKDKIVEEETVEEDKPVELLETNEERIRKINENALKSKQPVLKESKQEGKTEENGEKKEKDGEKKEEDGKTGQANEDKESIKKVIEKMISGDGKNEGFDDAEGFLSGLTSGLENGDDSGIKDLSESLLKGAGINPDEIRNFKGSEQELINKLLKAKEGAKSARNKAKRDKKKKIANKNKGKEANANNNSNNEEKIVKDNDEQPTIETVEEPKDDSSTEEEQQEPEEKEQDLKKRMKSKREEMISKRKKQVKESKNTSKPLSQIFFCDAEKCTSIMNTQNVKTCPVCQSFHYCSKDCQVAHWIIHKQMCGKSPTEAYKDRLTLYKEAAFACESLYQHVKDGNYTTVIHEEGNYPSCIFATLATAKSNVLNWKTYMKNPLFTTSSLEAFGSIGYKIQAAMDQLPTQKIFVITCIFTKLEKNETTEAIIRIFHADTYGLTMAAPTNGKLVKSVTKYKRK